MRAEIVQNEAAILLKGRRKILIVADLHLGLVPFCDEDLIAKLKSLANRVDEVIVLGDLKHRIGRYSRLRRLFEDFHVPVSVVRGNHDGGLEGFEVLSSKGIRIGNFGLFHGHVLPEEDVMRAKNWIIAHAHPSVLLEGIKERVWIFGEFEGRRVVVMPAFNDLCASTPVNVRRPAGFLFRRWDYGDAEVVMLDGTYLGKVNDLR